MQGTDRENVAERIPRRAVTTLLALHVVTAVAVAFGAPRLRRWVFLLALPAPAATFVWALVQTPAVLDGEVERTAWSWVPGLGLDLDLRLNGIALLMTLLISGVGVLVFSYSAWYFGDRGDLARFAGTLVLFAAAMLGLVWSANLLGLFVFWELTSICSYLLIGFNDRSETARNSALQALLITGGGGLALLFGFVLIGTAAGTYDLEAVLADPPRGGAVTAGVVLVLVGAFTKSAQVPFHGWLPGAMAAPTPVSAYLHSATMVKAGVYLVAVFAPAFADVGPWRPLTVAVGGTTMLWGAYQSLRRSDLKLILAYGTIAALGSMIATLGIGTPKMLFAGLALVFAHALYKAALFMVVGVVDHQAHSRDVHRLRGLRSVMPRTAVAAALAGASMAALPATFGFVAKEAALEGLLGAELVAAIVVLVTLLAYSAGTVAAVWRFLVGGFGSADVAPAPTDVRVPIDPAGVPPPSPFFEAPALMLAAFGLLFGVAPSIVNGLVEAAAASLEPAAGAYELHAFAGLNLAFGLSMAALAVGVVLAVGAGTVGSLQRRLDSSLDAAAAFRATYAFVLRTANQVVGIVQSGSLPVYLGVILLTFVVVPGVALSTVVGIPSDFIWSESPLQLIAGGAIVAATIGVTVIERRFAAVLLLGTVGYAMAVLFVAYNAPDLALTQFLVETIVVMAFVLVLRRMPDEFRPVRWRGRQVLRVGVSAGVGLVVFGFLLATGGDPAGGPPVEELTREAPPEAGGDNVVNVILTDVRALDTLGEVTVIAVAALGVISLGVLARRRDAGGEGPTPRLPPLGGSSASARSTVLDVAVRGITPVVVMLSLYFLLAGHNQPGGGFIGGLVAAAAVVLRFVAAPAAVRTARWLRAPVLVGGGLLLAVGVAIADWAFGTEVLDMGVATWELPLFGSVKVTAALPFDIGVYLVVVGTMIAILDALGGWQATGPEVAAPPGSPPRPAVPSRPAEVSLR